jgi:hypothetical protein
MQYQALGPAGGGRNDGDIGSLRARAGDPRACAPAEADGDRRLHYWVLKKFYTD